MSEEHGSDATSVAVIGAGPAGLSAAWRLVAAGMPVTIYEREGRVGGRMRTDEIAGVRVDPAVQFLASHYRETRSLAEEAGAGELLLRSPGRDAFWRDGRAHPLTYGSATSMAASGALPLGLKLRLLRTYMPFLLRNQRRLDAAEPARGVALEHDAESIARWGRRELGNDFVELLAYPLLAAYANTTPEEASAGYYHALSAAGLDVRLYSVRGGVGMLAEALAHALEGRGVHLLRGERVSAVEPVTDGVRVHCDGGVAEHAGAVIAVPRASLDAIVDLSGPVASWLSGVRTRPFLSVALLLRGRLDLDYFGLTFPRTEPPGDVLAAVCNLGAKPGGLVPEGRGALLAYPAPPEAERLMDASSERIVDRIVPALERAIPGVQRRIERVRVYPFPEGSTLLPPGGLEHLTSYDPTWLPAGLALAGDYLGAPTVEGAVRSGASAARHLLGSVRRA